MGEGVGTSVTSNVVSVDANTNLIDASLDATHSTATTTDVYRRVDANGFYKEVADITARNALTNVPENAIVKVIDTSNEEGNQTQWYKYASSTWTEVTASTPGEAYHKYDKGDTAGHWLYRTIGSQKYFLAVSWTMEFEYTFNAETAPLDIFLDTKKSEFTGHVALGANETQDTANGFRIAFFAGASSAAKVWGYRAPGTGATAYDSILHVSGNGTADVTKYSGSNYFSVDPNFSAADVHEDDDTSHEIVNRIGSIAAPASPATDNTGSLTVTCVAWYEGTDPDVISSNGSNALTKFQTLGAKMSFFARSNKVS